MQLRNVITIQFQTHNILAINVGVYELFKVITSYIIISRYHIIMLDLTTLLYYDIIPRQIVNKRTFKRKGDTISQ